MAFLFAPAAAIKITLDGAEDRKLYEVVSDNNTEKLPLYVANETVSGVINIVPSGKKLEHQGIKVEFIGQIGAYIFPFNESGKLICDAKSLQNYLKVSN